MHCEMVSCIYNRDSLYLLKETRLNTLGMCTACCPVRIPEPELSVLKETQLCALEVHWDAWQRESYPSC